MFSPSLTHTFVLRPDGLGLIVARANAAEPVAYEHQPLPEGVYGATSTGDLARFELSDAPALGEAIRQAIARSGRKVRQARLALDGALVRQLHLPLAHVPTDDELMTLVQTEAERYAIFGNAEVIVDFSVLRHDGETLSLLFAAFRRDVVSLVADAFASEGVTLQGIEPVACATLRGLMGAHPELFADDAGQTGVAAVGPHQVDVSTWSNGQLQSWRSIYLSEADLHGGDPQAVREAQLDLQRTAAEAPIDRWLLAHVPPSLESALQQLPGVALIRHRMGLAIDPQAIAWGAAAFAPDAGPFAFNLLPRQTAARRTFSTTQLVGGLLAAGILVTSLVAGLVLDGRLRAMRAEITALETETASLQSALIAPDTAGTGEQVVRAGLGRSAQASRVFAMLRDVTPGDVWMTKTDIEPGKRLQIQGFSMSRTSPMAFARALGNLTTFANVAMPELRQDTVQEQVVYRFEILADLPASEVTP